MKFLDLAGTMLGYLKIGGTSGVRLKNNAGDLTVRNTGDTADAAITVSQANVSGDIIVINSDAAGTGADWKVTLSRAISGMIGHLTFTLPSNAGSTGQILTTDGSGGLSWTSPVATASSVKTDTTSLVFGDGATVSLFSTGASDIIKKIEVVVDTAFNGTAPTLSIGISGTVSKYTAVTDVDLKTVGSYEISPNKTAQGVEALIATYSASSSTAGAARILVDYVTPS